MLHGLAESKFNWRVRILTYSPLILWIGVILFLGSESGSQAQTSRFIRPLIDFFFPSADPDTVLIIHAVIRKTAHFVEYGLLAMLAARAFSQTSATVLRRHWFVISLALVIAVAVIDETGQSSLSSRTASVWDVLLDAAGGVATLTALFFLRRKTRT